MKDHATFLAAMAELPSLTGVMVGEGTSELAAPPNVRALGRRRDTPALYAAADIVASTSAFGEGFSNVIAEGMSAGLVPVATDVGDAAALSVMRARSSRPAMRRRSARAIAMSQRCPTANAPGAGLRRATAS